MCQLWPTTLRSATVFTVTVVKPFTPSSGQIKITQKTKYLFVNPKVRIDFQKVLPKRFHLNGNFIGFRSQVNTG